MKDEKKYQTIINNKLVYADDNDHPDKSKKDKNWIVNEFINDFNGNAIFIREFENKDKKNLGQLNEVEIFGKKYFVFFNLFGRGGKDKDKIKKFKIAIPFNNEQFRNKIIEKNVNNVYVVNLFRPLLKNGEVDENKRIWFIINPFEIFDCSGYKNIEKNKKHVPSSRWFEVNDAWKIINENKEVKVHKNSNGNVFALSNKSIANLWKNPEIHGAFFLKNNIKNYAMSYFNNNSKKGREYNLSCLRKKFRELLLCQEIQNNQTDSKVKHKSLLIASHIHSVENIESSNKNVDDKIKEIVDVNNGLLIPVGMDKLFDKYLITFDDEWNILISSEIETSELEEITSIKILENNNEDKSWIKGKSKESLLYLKKHRTEAFNKRKYDPKIIERFKKN